MQRGFLDDKKNLLRKKNKHNFPSAASAKAMEEGPITVLRKKFAEAEKELRRLRKERISSRGESSVVTATSALSRSNTTTIPVPPLSQDACEALVSHTEPPPPVLHRLGHVLLLLLEAPMLVGMCNDLGCLQLPENVPWRNIQTLVKKEWSTEGISGALVESRFGWRLLDHIKKLVQGGDRPLTRKDVLGADVHCSHLFDFVVAHISFCEAVDNVSPELSEAYQKMDAVMVDAIEAQEREVARLRRELSKAEQSEEAAHEFAARNMPFLGAYESIAERISTEEDSTPIASIKPITTPGPSTASYGFNHTLQYKLNEIAVPTTQESILKSMANALTDARFGRDRRLEVVGVCEDREEPEAALERVAAVRVWMEEQGVDTDKLNMSTLVAGDRGNRRVELRLHSGTRSGNTQQDPAALQRAGTAALPLSAPAAVGLVPLATAVAMKDATVHDESYAGTPLEKPATEYPQQFTKLDRNSCEHSEDGGDHVLSPAECDTEKSRQFHVERNGCLKDFKITPLVEVSLQPQPALTCTASTKIHFDAFAPPRAAESEASTPLRPLYACSVVSARTTEVPTGPTAEIAQPTAIVEEVQAADRRVVRVVFTMPGRNAADAEVEVGARAVRLASNSNAWSPVQVSLPFFVDSSSSKGARFSRKAGTLTLLLSEAVFT